MASIFCCGGSGAMDAVKDTAKAKKDRLKEKLHHDETIVRQNAAMLYGVLTLKIIAGRNLPNTDIGLLRKDDLTDAYVTVDTFFEGKETARIAKTHVVDDCLDPVWDETFVVQLCHAVEDFNFHVKDRDQLRNEKFAELTVRAEDVTREGGVKGWHRLRRVGGTGSAGELNIEATFVSALDEAGSNEVPRTYFPLRTGCRVKLYQDAHTPAVPPVTDVTATDGSGPYSPPCLWEDTLDAIEKAQKFIYIVGWAVWNDLYLKRGGSGGSPEYDETLGALLTRKAKSGVRVCVAAWEEKFSSDVAPCGLMGTHDHTMRNWFNSTESGVHIFLSPRGKSKAEKMLESTWVETTYTHHQKCVILDAATGDDEENRHIVAFVGGIDLTDGRWDTPAHELYKTLPQEHAKDFYNGTAPSTSLPYGPRQPWHDIHMYVEGGTAHDLAANFHERWMKQNSQWHMCLYRDIRTEFGRPADEAGGIEDDGDRAWNTQLFRSINMDSADFDPKAKEDGRLTHRKGRIFDDSIQRAYIHHIRRARRFIYIENQYFLGSCFSWKLPETTKCPHLIPMELTARIERAIEDDENFRVYITVPIQPEGDPTSAAVQEVLRWQFRTLEMMYRRIGKAIEKKGLGDAAHPRDYLSVYCLTKRESKEDLPSEGLEDPPPNSVAAKCRESLRFMIYVHSKFAIFDDEYVIVGSANINERSMNGNRDTELAMGAYQPAFTKEAVGTDDEICGDVRTFRLALWAEHCGKHMEEHLRPSSKGCMDAMNALADENLDRFVGDEVARNDSHLTRYPLGVDKDGDVDEMEKCPTFPDLGGSIKGKNSAFLPNSVTT